MSPLPAWPEARVLAPGAAGYPETLGRLPAPPPRFHVRGELPLGGAPTVAVVGTRTPGAYGRRMARSLAEGLARAGVWVVSGLARGVDAEAHAACLAAGGRTVAVLGSGLDRVWPPENLGLARRILDGGGALVSQFPMDDPPLKWHFPARNAVISGLSLAVVVVEGARGSGSMITAREALDQGREVLAVPGLADDPLAQGPLDLLADGAGMARGAEDVLAALGLPAPRPARGAGPGEPPEGLGADALALWRALGAPGAPAAERLAGMDAARLAAARTELELKGILRP